AALGAAGAAVVVNYAADAAGAQRVVAEIVSRDGRAVAVQGDVSRAEDVQRLFAAAGHEFGAPDIVVNNAGVFRFDLLEGVTAQEFHREFDINVLGTLLVTQEAAKHFGPAGGSVINVSSVVATSPGPGMAVYAATKAAVDSLTRVLASELGVVGSEMARQLVAKTPLGRMGQPTDIGPVAVFLASDEAHWITGESL